jgi:hypothetical protein
MTKQRLAGLIGLVFVVTVGVWWTAREVPNPPANANVQQLQDRIALLEERLEKLETARPDSAIIQYVPAEVVPEQRGERREINGMTYYVQPLGAE